MHDESADDMVDAVSISLTFYFEKEPNPVPEFLVGRRGRNPNVHAYGFHLFSEEPDFRLRSDAVNAFVAECSRTLAPEVDEGWLVEHGCELRAYIRRAPGQLTMR